MAASKKDGGKNKKFERNSRAPCNSGRSLRLERNKAKRIARHAKRMGLDKAGIAAATAHVCASRPAPDFNAHGVCQWITLRGIHGTKERVQVA